jgi:PAS domain-containing protein
MGDGKRTMWEAMNTTDRDLVEESLLESEGRTRAILRAIPDLMFLQNREGTYLDYHSADPRQLLIPPTSFLGKNMREVLPPELAESLIRCFERVQETEEPQVLEYSLPIQDEERWYEARVNRPEQWGQDCERGARCH